MHSLKRFIVATGIICAASFVMAALPPHYQRLAELSAVLENPAVVEAFGISRPIDGILYVDVDLYAVTSGECTLLASIVTVPMAPGMVGARQFTVEVGELDCG